MSLALLTLALAAGPVGAKPAGPTDVTVSSVDRVSRGETVRALTGAVNPRTARS